MVGNGLSLLFHAVFFSRWMEDFLGREGGMEEVEEVERVDKRPKKVRVLLV